MSKLSDKQIRFCQEYCVDWNGTQAAIRAGYSQNSATEQAARMLTKDHILEYIEEVKAQLAAKAELTPLWVLQQWKQIATADANELTQLRRVNCRHCHGADHAYQWTESEYTTALNKAIDSGKDAPDGIGGFGFDLNGAPNPECPECGGLGIETIYTPDTRTLKGDARRLYAGIKRTKEGLQILTRDQDAALTNIAKFLGMSLERKEISGPNGTPLAIASIKPEDLTDDQLAAIIGIPEDDDN